MVDLDLLTTADVSAILNISTRRVRAIAQARGVGYKLPGSGQWLFDCDDVAAMQDRPVGRPKERGDKMPKRWRLVEGDIAASDLLEEQVKLADQGIVAEGGLVVIEGIAEAAEYLWVPSIGRVGIAWGADADWADVPSRDEGIEMWLNDGEQFAARN